MATAYNTADRQLLAVAWPGRAEDDVRTLVRAQGVVVGDIDGFDVLDGLTIGGGARTALTTSVNAATHH